MIVESAFCSCCQFGSW